MPSPGNEPWPAANPSSALFLWAGADPDPIWDLFLWAVADPDPD